MRSLRGTHRAIRTEAGADRAYRRAVARRPGQWLPAARMAHAQTAVDPYLVCAVMAVEHGARGRAARGIEYAFVLGLCAVGRQWHAEWVSVGPAQVQLRHAGAGCRTMPRLRQLATAEGSALACARVIAEACHVLHLDPSAPGTWTSAGWRALGCAYSGPLARGYGAAARLVWCRLLADQASGSAWMSEATTEDTDWRAAQPSMPFTSTENAMRRPAG